MWSGWYRAGVAPVAMCCTLCTFFVARCCTLCLCPVYVSAGGSIFFIWFWFLMSLPLVFVSSKFLMWSGWYREAPVAMCCTQCTFFVSCREMLCVVGNISRVAWKVYVSTGASFFLSLPLVFFLHYVRGTSQLEGVFFYLSLPLVFCISEPVERCT